MIVLIADVGRKEHPVVTTPETIMNSHAAPILEAAVKVLLDKLAEVTGVPPIGLHISVSWADGSVEPKEIDLSQYVNPNLN